MRKQIKRKFMAIVLTLTLVISLLPAMTLTASAASGTVSFNATDSTNIGQILYDGQSGYSNDISGIQLNFFNASSAEDAASRTSTGSFVYFGEETFGPGGGAITPISGDSGQNQSSSVETPKILVMYSADGSEFNFKSLYIYDNYTQYHTVIEGFRDGISTGTETCTLDEENGEYSNTFSFMSGVLQNVDEIRITNADTWTNSDLPTTPHGNWAYFNNFEIGDPVSSSTAPDAPTVTAGEESITVSSFTSGADLSLYLSTGGTAVATATNVTDSTYTFTNVEPNSTQYYVTQTVGGEESTNSSFVNSTLRTPAATAGIGYVDVSNVYAGATITLYNSGGTSVSSSPADNGDGTYRFSGLTAGNSYYVQQSINSVVSGASSTVVVLDVAAPDAPTVTAGEESITVSSFTSGADLSLYLSTGGTAVATATNVTDVTYTFTNVEPNSTQYYVTQTVGGEESTNSSFVNSTLRTPAATAGIGYVDVSNVYAGATITLYNSGGTSVSSSPADNGDGTYRFSGLTAGNSYYVQQSINSVVSGASSTVVVLDVAAPDAPTVTAGEESITVSSFTSGADLSLYLSTGGTAVATATNVTDSTYTFTNVEPNSTQYYVTQTVGGEESTNSSFVNSTLRTPAATAGIGYVDVSNVYAGATITLYNSGGTSVSSSPADNGDGTYRFSGLTAGNSYYVQQSINSVVSGASSTVVVLDVAAPDAPTVTAGEESITVSSFTSGADLSLYLSTGGTAVATATNVTDSTYTFTNVEPNSIQYYVTQTVGGEESTNSSFVNSTLRTPAATAGIGYVDVSNVYAGATITLYNSGGTSVSSSPADNGDGTYRFSGLTAGNSYYVQQSINSVVSGASSTVVVLDVAAPAAPNVAAEEESITVSSFTSGADLSLYLSTGGTAVATATNVTDVTYTFTNVEPNSTQYYVTQTVGGEESTNSAFVNPTLRIPAATAGIGYVNVSNVYTGATVTLYTFAGTPVSSSPTDNGDGTFRFSGLTAGDRFYVVQSINSVVSTGSNTVTVPTTPSAPTNVTATASNGKATVSFTASSDDGGNAITGYIVKSNPGGITATGTGTTITVTGLSNGTSYTFMVMAVNGVGNSTESSASNAVTPYRSSSTSGKGSSSSTQSSGASVIINGESKTAGTSKTTTGTDGQTTTTLTVDTDKLEDILEYEGSGATVIIPVNSDSSVAAGVLTGEMVKNMENREATLVVQTDSATYTLPASEIDINAVSAQLGTDISLSDIKVTVEIAEPSTDTVTVVENAAEDGGFSIVVPAVDFTISCTYGRETVDVSSFNAYVERMIAIPHGVDPAKITTGVVVKPDGTTYHVPTQVVKIDGKYYAKINSLTNSTYTVIWHPIKFADVASHWAKDAVNNMGSRMVVNGDKNGNYNPDNNITRAEFVTIVVRALGLAPDTGESSFSDADSSAWYCGYVENAASYGIVRGYDNRNFGPNDMITREQAMTMIARAMKITDLEVSLTDSEIRALLETYIDGLSASGYAKDSVAICLKTGIISGTSDSTIDPKDYITRAEVAVIVERLLQKSGLI